MREAGCLQAVPLKPRTKLNCLVGTRWEAVQWEAKLEAQLTHITLVTAVLLGPPNNRKVCFQGCMCALWGCTSPVWALAILTLPQAGRLSGKLPLT